MKQRTAQRIVLARSAGPRLRCFLEQRATFVLAGRIFVALAVVMSAGIAAAQVDCVMPAPLTVSRVQGQVFDWTGTGVPGVAITLVSRSGAMMRTTAGQEGRFQIPVPPGQYFFKAIVPMFQTASGKLTVREDTDGHVRPSYLYVIVGMGGSFCPWMTTSKREFRKIILDNKKRLKETAQKHATQK